nr:MAG TPA: hypothetical protein [Caudoviricetes sp.]
MHDNLYYQILHYQSSDLCICNIIFHFLYKPSRLYCRMYLNSIIHIQSLYHLIYIL